MDSFHTNLLEHRVSLTNQLAYVTDYSLLDLHQLILLDLGIAQTLSVLNFCFHHLDKTEEELRKAQLTQLSYLELQRYKTHIVLCSFAVFIVYLLENMSPLPVAKPV